MNPDSLSGIYVVDIRGGEYRIVAENFRKQDEACKETRRKRYLARVPSFRSVPTIFRNALLTLPSVQFQQTKPSYNPSSPSLLTSSSTSTFIWVVVYQLTNPFVSVNSGINIAVVEVLHRSVEFIFYVGGVTRIWESVM